MSYKICALIPTFNHHKAVPTIVARCESAGLESLIVDDGSNETTKDALGEFSCLTLPHNQGKGTAILEGLRLAKTKGYTHVFQIDADGQHALDTLETLLDLSQRNPQALVSGQPIYDESIPLSRKIGRWFTHVWVWIETLSFRITDSMCGCRIYPVEQTLKIMETHSVGKRMDFDTEVMVRLFWAQTPVVMSPVRVTYPLGNHSNFNAIGDNWRITKMHTKLFFEMIWNLPQVLKRRPDYKTLDITPQNTHWASLKERAPLLGFFILAYLYRLFGKKAVQIIGCPIVFYYYLTNHEQRKASQEFLGRVTSQTGVKLCSFKHFLSFFEMALDKFGAWIGQTSQVEATFASGLTFNNLMKSSSGGMLLVSHLGNMEFCRAVAQTDHQCRMHVLLHSKNAQQYKRLLAAFNPKSTLNVIEVTDVGPDTIMYLKDRVSQGDWVVIAGDRVPVAQNGRVTMVPFLKENAPFSQGPYILASLLECPVYMAAAIREDLKIKIFLTKLTDLIQLNRKNREADICGYATKYSQFLETLALKYPYQWFNFYCFWKKSSYI